MESEAKKVRAMFDEVIAETTDPDARAMREILREYFTTPAFRSAMADAIARINDV